MNKKFLIFGLMGLFAISLVAATIINYYGTVEQEITIQSPITIDGEPTVTFSGYAGDMFEGEEITINNAASFGIEVNITNDAPDGVTVNYLTGLSMFTKNETWEETDDLTATFYYTLVGEDFIYKVSTTSNLTDYVVVYYPDIDGNPGSWNIENAKKIGDVTSELTVSDIDAIPFESDFNDGAKIWLIPSEDWEVQSWNPLEWLFEHELINSNVELVTIDGVDSITVIPVYTIDPHYIGLDNITTTIA